MTNIPIESQEKHIEKIEIIIEGIKTRCTKRSLIPIKERGSNGKENKTIKGRYNEVSKHLR